MPTTTTVTHNPAEMYFSALAIRFNIRPEVQELKFGKTPFEIYAAASKPEQKITPEITAILKKYGPIAETVAELIVAGKPRRPSDNRPACPRCGNEKDINPAGGTCTNCNLKFTASEKATSYSIISKAQAQQPPVEFGVLTGLEAVITQPATLAKDANLDKGAWSGSRLAIYDAFNLIFENRITEGIKSVRRAIDKDPDYGLAHEMLSYLESGRPESAKQLIQSYQKSLVKEVTALFGEYILKLQEREKKLRADAESFVKTEEERKQGFEKHETEIKQREEKLALLETDLNAAADTVRNRMEALKSGETTMMTSSAEVQHLKEAIGKYEALGAISELEFKLKSLGELQGTVAKLEAEVSAYKKSNLTPASVGELNEKAEGYRARNAELQEKEKELKKKVDASAILIEENGKTIADIREQNKKLEDELQQTKLFVDNYNNLSAVHATLKTAYEELSKDHAGMRQKLLALATAAEHVGKECELAKAHNNSLKTQQESLEKRLNSTSEQLKLVQQETASLETQCTKEKAEALKYRMKSAELDEHLKPYKNLGSHEDFENAIRAAKEKPQLEARLAELSKQNEESGKRIKAAESSMRLAGEEYSSLDKKYAEACQQNKQLSERMAPLSDYVVGLASDLEQLRLKTAALQEKLAAQNTAKENKAEVEYVEMTEIPLGESLPAGDDGKRHTKKVKTLREKYADENG